VLGYYRTATGGGLQGHGDINLTNATISGNTVGSDCASCLSQGGGIYEAKYGNLTLTSSTVSGNSVNATGDGAAAGGGITTKYRGSYNVITLTNSTLSGNSVSAVGNPDYAFGGAVYQAGTPYYGSIVSSNSTIANNTSTGLAGGVFVGYGATATFNSTIIGTNTADGNPDTSDFGTYSTSTIGGDYNLIQTDPSPAGFTITGTNSIIGSDPQLAPLADNGGPTFTHALASTSPAIDKGINPLALPNDQRGPGFQRVFGAAPDIGAFEYVADEIFGNGFD
jgi:hypothetical protein